MVRTYKRKTNIANVDEELIFSVIKHVKETGASVRGTAKQFGLNYKSLGRYIDKVKDKDLDQFTVQDVKCRYQNQYKLLMSKEDEDALTRYILRSAEIF